MSLFDRCAQFESLAAAKPLPIKNPYESGVMPVVKRVHHSEHEKPSPQKEFEAAHHKSRKMIISKEQALEELVDNGIDPKKFLSEMGDAEFYPAKEFLLWVMNQ